MAPLKPINSLKDLPEKELITGGTYACAGCQAVAGYKYIVQALGKNTILVNTSGCMTLTATSPYTPFMVPWVHGAIENGGAVSTGIFMGLKALKKDKDINIVVYAGDGATYDIGLQSLSGMAIREENVIYVCYNNCSYANTGFQSTSATPLYASTSTAPRTKSTLGDLMPRKNLAKIMVDHHCPYVATACMSYPIDFMNKLRKAASIKGAKYIEVLSPCVPGWGINAEESIKAGKLMVQSGLWPVYEVENKEFKLTIKPSMIPVEKVFKLQGRYKTMEEKQIKEIQEIVNKEWDALSKGFYWKADEY